MNPAENNFSIFKTDSDKKLVFGWASVAITIDGEQLEDRQKDIIDPEDLEEAAYEYVLNFRDTGEEHIPTMRKKGKLVESCVLTAEKQKAMGIPEGAVPVGWWIGFKIEDDAAWERVKSGQYRMFSIEGKANRIPVEKSDKPTGCGVLVVRDGKVLTGTRIERASRGQICGPGGHIEAGETPEEAAVREAHEEFGITCHDLKPLGTLPDGTSAIFMCSSFSGTPRTDEEEMTDVQWIAPEEIEEADAFPPFWQSLKLLTIEKSRSSYDEYPSYSMWLEENLDATIEQQKAAKEYYQAHKDDAERDWKWNPDRKNKPVAKTFEDVLKFNPYHDGRGRFASANSATSFTWKPGASKMHDKAIAGEKDRTHRSDFRDKIKGLILTSYTYDPKETPQMLIGIGKEVAKEIDARFKAKKKAGETTENEPQTEDIYDVLRDVRSFGPGEYANKVFNSSDLDDKRTKAIMDDALGRYPTDWYADAIFDCGVDIRDKAGRAAHYIGYDSTSQIKVYAKESPELVKQLDLKSDSITNLGIANQLAHELGHYFERSNIDVGNAARAYYEKRTKNSELTEMYPGEYTKKDRFADEYMGKYYTSGSTEITSMLVQKLGYLDPKKSITQDLFSNQKKDVQSYNFILGLLAGGGTKWEE